VVGTARLIVLLIKYRNFFDYYYMVLFYTMTLLAIKSELVVLEVRTGSVTGQNW